MHLVYRSTFATTAARLFAFHERPDAFALLQPPWQHAEIVQPPASLAVGTRVILRVRQFGIPLTIVAEHVAYDPPHMFADTMVRGPFATWLHRHIVEPVDATHARLVDDITCTLPLGVLGRLGEPIARRQIDRLFRYRHDVTRRTLT